MDNKKERKKNKLYRPIMTAVVLFVAMIGISGFISLSNKKVKDDIAKVDIDNDILTEEAVSSIADDGMIKLDDYIPSEEYTAKEQDEEQPVQEAAAAAAKMVMPTTGDVLTDYSDDKLVYNKTLDDWRAHKAIDIANKVGTPVAAAMDGTVEQIENDAMMGITVTIKHSDTLITKYCNLQKDVVVKKGDLVKTGDIIGGIGNSASAEKMDSPHLHFEVRENNMLINPYNFF